MKNRIYLILGFAFILVIAGCGKKDTDKVENARAAMFDEPVIYYTCPMEEHMDVHSDKPGTCSKCNMELVAGVITSVENMEFYGCPMEIHSHVRSDSPGTCDDCGMKLKPMRLVKKG